MNQSAVTIRKDIARASKVLVVDDNATSRLMLSEICRSEGIEQLEEASYGDEALRKAIQWKPDLILLDMHMPQMDGIQVCRALKEVGLLKDMVVIMVTTFDDVETKVRAFDVGVMDFISKPIQSDEVLSRAMAHLERQHLRRQLDMDYARIQSELSEAIMLQHVLLPQPSLLQSIRDEYGLDIAHYYHPASELAGDYVSVRKLANGKIALISADVSGHGVTAALYGFSLHALITDALLEVHEPSEVLAYLNHQLHSVMMLGKFATAFIGILDIKNSVLSYASAATPAVLLVSGSNVQTLHAAGNILGVDRDVSWETYRIPFAKGDVIFAYSDALIETADALGNLLSIHAIKDVLGALAAENASHILNALLASFYQSDRQTVDDLSMLVCK